MAFRHLDRSLALAEAHHANVLMTLGLTPRWASARPQEASGYAPGYAAEPKDIEDWRIFVRTVATRYKGRIHAYEIWNEPNVKRFWTGSIDQLVDPHPRSFLIIHKVDPRPWWFPADRLPESNGCRSFYVRAASTWTSSGIIFTFRLKHRKNNGAVHRKSKKVMPENGARISRFGTEAGWFPPAQIDSEVGAAYLARSYIVLWAEGIQRFYWYSWDNHLKVAVRTTESDSKTLTPAGRAYETIQKWLIGARMDWCKADMDSTWTCQLSRDKGSQWIVWNPEQTRTFAVPSAWHVRNIVPLLGDPQPLKGTTVEIGQTRSC